MTTNPLVAAPVEGPANPWAGVWIAEDIQLIGDGIRNGSWIDGTLGVVGASLDGLALVSDPVGSLLQYGVAWIIEHVRPLTEALDWLAGDPAQIAAHVQTWRNVAGSLRDEAESLARAVRMDVAEWSGSAGPAYRARAGEQQQAVAGLSRAADTMALATEAAGILIAAVRLMVRDAIATCVSRLIVYAVEEAASFGFATPLVVEQVTTTVAAWGAKIAQWLRGLLASLRRLIPELHQLGALIGKLKQILNRLSRSGKEPQPPHQEPERPPPAPGGTSAPDFTDPEIDSRKITSYAMNPDHPVGKNKYRVINSATGLEVGDAALIEDQIRNGVREGAPMLGKADQYGQRWSVDVPLTGPNGTIMVRTAWMLEAGSATPRLITISFP
ncbi:WXG100 family type VII secretion target [Micromonospora sp. NBC_00898]|uniref:WXG100 family type VII secretion target n=1 Tax=Micromonospora sp. NBC_00898 TaxID=2975981 RepID=UPI00386F19CF|nr:WXG100 family type VII secretion target [Micromonospora sp. NBC_00898]